MTGDKLKGRKIGAPHPSMANQTPNLVSLVHGIVEGHSEGNLDTDSEHAQTSYYVARFLTLIDIHCLLHYIESGEFDFMVLWFVDLCDISRQPLS